MGLFKREHKEPKVPEDMYYMEWFGYLETDPVTDELKYYPVYKDDGIRWLPGKPENMKRDKKCSICGRRIKKTDAEDFIECFSYDIEEDVMLMLPYNLCAHCGIYIFDELWRRRDNSPEGWEDDIDK